MARQRLQSQDSFCARYSITSLDLDSVHDFSDSDEDSIGADSLDVDDATVSFGSVEIREFPVTVDDHASFKDSCPLTLTWNHLRTMESTVDKFE